MKVDICTMEGLLRGKCLPAKMLVNESLSAYLVRQFDALHERAETAERERDEAIAQRDKSGESFYKAVQYGAKLEAELARRDAAASEPVAWTDDNGLHLLKETVGVMVQPTQDRGGNISLFTAAPPAVLPPEKPVHTDLSRTDIMKNIAYNQALNDVKELGAQPQKPVVLQGGRLKPDGKFWYDEDTISSILKRAGVEVKK